MTKIILQKNRGPVQLHLHRSGAGFVILFAVTLTAVILTIALGVASVAYNETKFATSVRDGNDAFEAADTGVECALFYDKPPSLFPLYNGSGVFSPQDNTIPCAGASDTHTNGPGANTTTYKFFVTGLGSQGKSCAIVTVKKDGDSRSPYIRTTVISKGYNIGSGSGVCNISNPEPVERQLELTY